MQFRTRLVLGAVVWALVGAGASGCLNRRAGGVTAGGVAADGGNGTPDAGEAAGDGGGGTAGVDAADGGAWTDGASGWADAVAWDVGPTLDAGSWSDSGPDAAPSGCPKAVIQVPEGDAVVSPATLHLTGSHSVGFGVEVTAYEWTVQGPPGFSGKLKPSATVADPTFEATTPGTYTFRLDVWDANGVKSCNTAEAQVTVTLAEAIRVELTWETPADPDPTDQGPEAGADLNLHFVHPAAQGPQDCDGDGQNEPYFDSKFDCYWFNKNPDWGAAVDGSDDPWLDRDATSGPGPEVIQLDYPEAGLTYRVGVSYWSDHGFGESLATVRIFIHKQLAFEAPGVALQSGDLWEVATITWPEEPAAAGAEPVVAPVLAPDDGLVIYSQCKGMPFMN